MRAVRAAASVVAVAGAGRAWLSEGSSGTGSVLAGRAESGWWDRLRRDGGGGAWEGGGGQPLGMRRSSIVSDGLLDRNDIMYTVSSL